ncbi:MlaD family protein [Pseudomarimonas salicorniae]|uniref:MlaD family protein n=1 Tax=Pseudomarimonas salicorniae TaxID=2933270 RepID=A0ABT0GGG6_9GAMM|nr:MlaD family protein [Lysobacter sp. CAU 1642]MCK7593634.1 MlaD family protein [Lysobacter sp. CAU 1642]
MRRDNVNYVLVGAAVIAALVLLFFTLLTITGRGGDTVDYRVEFHNVAGLGHGAPVFYEGFRIGQVSGIEPGRVDGRTRYRVTLSLREDWKIPADSIAQRQASGLLADMTVGIREGASAQMLEPGSTIPSIESGDVFSAVNDLATELTVLSQERLRPLVDTLATRVESIAGTVDASAPALLAEAQQLLERLNVAADRANRMLDEPNQQAIAGLLADVRTVAAELKTTRANADALLDSLKGAVDENRPALQQTVLDLERTVGSVAQRIDAITRNLESSSRNFDEFSREIRRSPNRLLFTPPADQVEE